MSHPSYRRLTIAFRGVVWYYNFNNHESQYYILILFHVFCAVCLTFSLILAWWVTTRHLTVWIKCDFRVYAFLLLGDCEHKNISQCKAMQQRYNCLKRFLRHTVQHSCNVRISVDFLLDNGQKSNSNWIPHLQEVVRLCSLPRERLWCYGAVMV